MRKETGRERLFWAVLALEMGLFLGWQLSHLGGFQWGRDEGIYMMRVRLLQDGYRLYRDIWTDQLPGLIELLWGAYTLFGTSVELGRALVVLLASVGLLSTALLARQLGGSAGALAVVPLLALAPNHFWLSRAVVSPDLPSISLGIASLAAVGRYVESRHRRWLVLSGLAMSAGLYIKATAILTIVPGGLWLLMDWWPASKGHLLSRKTIHSLLETILIWGGSTVLPFSVALAFHDLPALWQQFVVTQVASGQMALKVVSHAVKILRYLGEYNWGLGALAAAGTVAALQRRPRTALIVGIWLVTCLTVLLVRSPLWPSHHFIVLLPPLAVFSGTGLSALVDVLRRSRPWRDVWWVAMAIGIYGASLPGIVGADARLLVAPTYQSSLEAVAFLRENLPPGAVVVSDYHMIPFRAGCRVPPQLATVSKKRVELELLTTDEIKEVIEQSQAEAVLLWSETLFKRGQLTTWLRDRHVLGFKRSYHEIYVRLKPGSIQYSQEALLGESLRLLGYSLSDRAVDPGEQLEVSLYWRVLAPITYRYHGFVHLLTLEGEQVSQQDQVAWGIYHPSWDWEVGETVLDRYTLSIPADVVPGSYVLSVGLYDGDTHDRLAVRDAQGQLLGGDQIILDQRPVIRGPAQYQAPAVAHPVGARLGQVARLVGYDLSQQAHGLEVTLVWEALTPPAGPAHTVFVHLRDDGARLVAQHDGVPNEGRRPTLGWRSGEFVVDQHVLPTRDLPAGDYGLFVGMYDPTTGERLPSFDANGEPLPAGEIQLKQLVIQPVE